MIEKSIKTALLVLTTGLFFLISSCSNDSSPASPYSPDTPDTSEDNDKTWEEVLSEDPSYPPNVYLTEFIEWSPGQVGSSRMGTEYTDSEGYPLESGTVNAFGPPEGGGSYTGGDGLTCPIGIDGWAVWKFNPDYIIVNGEGADFTTFTKTWAWSSKADGLCCELARVEVSEDGTVWYEMDSALIRYDENPIPAESNSSYIYTNVQGLHGNAPTWANFRRDMPAEELQTVDGVLKWVETEETVSRYFTAGDTNLGGISFDLSDFHLKGDPAESWPADGKMRYLKIIDDSSILDGQDYAREWALGANLMAAMGFHTAPAE